MSDKSSDDWLFPNNQAAGSLSQISKQTDESFGMEWMNIGNEEVASKETDYQIDLKDLKIPMPLELNAYRDKSLSSDKVIENFDEIVSNVNLDVEAENFILAKSDTSVFHSNFDYFEKKLVLSHDTEDFQDFVTSRLKDAIERSYRQEALNIEVPSKTSEEKIDKSKISKKRSHSPDLFEESSDDDEIKPNFESKLNGNLSPNLFDTLESGHAVMTRSKTIANQAIVSATTCYIGNDRRDVLINRIEDFMLKLLTDLVKTSNIKFKLPKTTDWKNCGLVDGILTLNDSKTLSYRTVSLKNTGSKFRISLIMHILSEMYHQLIIGTTSTVRELYYQDPDLAQSQINISNAIRDICVILDATPWEIGIHSSSKGLIAGAIRITLSNDEIIDCSTYNGPTLLPSDVNGIKSLETKAKYLLIVEKDTIFEMLLKQNVLTNIGHDIILITGKGFPDINTRLMVKKIWTEHKIPIYALVDADPFGIEILFVYKYGSRSMVHNSDKLACPQINWIGIHPSEIESLAIPSMALNREDKKRIKDLIKRSYISDQIREELIVLERKNRKAEIEGVSSFSLNFLISDYIPNKIKRNLII